MTFINVDYYARKYTVRNFDTGVVMEVFSNLFDNLMGWLTIGIVVFMLVMMAYLFSMFINKSGHHK
jgi:hypothetical protein